jgi:hypothetical protein
MKIRIVFWAVLPCKIIVDNHPWWRRQHVPLKRRWTVYIDPVPAVFWRPGCWPQCMSRLQCQNWTSPETDMSVWSRAGGVVFIENNPVEWLQCHHLYREDNHCSTWETSSRGVMEFDCTWRPSGQHTSMVFRIPRVQNSARTLAVLREFWYISSVSQRNWRIGPQNKPRYLPSTCFPV